MKCAKCGYNSFEYLDNCKKCNNSLAAFKESVGIRPVILPAGVFIASVAEAVDATGAQGAGQGTPGEDVFQWDTPSATASTFAGGPGEDDFELSPGGIQNSGTPLTSDPFAFDDELPAQTTSPAAAPSDPFDEFSFELPVSQETDISSHDEAAGSALMDQAQPQESVDSIFGEFSFGESEDAGQAGATEPGEVTHTDLSGEGMPFDPFGDLDGADLTQEDSSQPAETPGEFDLSSFMAMEDAGAATGENPPAQPEGGAKLTGMEFDALFGELEETEKKG